MSNIGVNSLDGLFSSNQLQSKTSVKSTENFDDTLKGVSDSDGKSKVLNKEAKTDVNESESSRKDKDTDSVSKFESSKRREMVKKQDEPTDEQIQAAMEEVVSQIKEFIQEHFNVSEEELENMMVDLNITGEQLLDVNALTKLVMKLDGIENSTDMLTSPNFNADLKELLNQVEQIKNEVLDNGKISEIVPEVDPAGSKVEELENIENMENVENIETDETDIAVDEEANVETEEVSDVKESVVENTTVASENTVETETNGQENGQMEQKETKKFRPFFSCSVQPWMTVRLWRTSSRSMA